MISSAEAAAYLRWTEGDESSLRFVSSKTRFIGAVVRLIIPARFKRIAQRRCLLSKALVAELNKHGANTIIDLGAGYSTSGTCWLGKHPEKRVIEVDTEALIRRKKALLPSRKSLTLVAGDIADPAVYASLRSQMKRGPLVVLLEGVISYLDKDELDVCLTGVEGLLRARGGVLITHQTASTREGRTLRSVLWGKRTETDIVVALRHRRWTVSTKHSFGWEIVVAKFSPAVGKMRGSSQS